MLTWFVQENVTLGWADLCGSEGALLSGQNASGSGQNPTANPFCADRGTWISRLKTDEEGIAYRVTQGTLVVGI